MQEALLEAEYNRLHVCDVSFLTQLEGGALPDSKLENLVRMKKRVSIGQWPQRATWLKIPD